MRNFDVIIVGAGPGGIFAAYELVKLKPALRVYSRLVTVWLSANVPLMV